MSDLVKAVETFFWEGGKVDWDAEYPADDAAVKAFPHHFEPVEAEIPAAPAKRGPGRPKKAAGA